MHPLINWAVQFLSKVNWTVIVIILGAIFILRQGIATQLLQLRSLIFGRLKLDFFQRGGVPESNPRAEAERLLRQLGESQLLREAEEEIRQELTRRNLTGTEAIPVLRTYLAAANIARTFERTYQVIFGSQLRALEFLNSSQTGQPIEALRPFYVAAALQHVEFYRAYSFDQWLSFMLTVVLVRRDGGIVNITVRGREFLTYAIREGLSLDKPG